MFKEIFLFELKYRFKRPATYLYFALLFLFMFLNIIYGSGPASEKANLNSPYGISQMLIIISIFASLISSAIMGVPAREVIVLGADPDGSLRVRLSDGTERTTATRVPSGDSLAS